MPTIPACSQCGMENTYPDGENYVCADCGHEWPAAAAEAADDDALIVKDANGNLLHDGDAVVLIKDLKVKGGSTLKMGTKIKSIRLVSGDHEV
ncbi:MAG: alkylphosphonate utilization protein, partial [Betaproteobacteria bacterium HGW-Betaproteobacteria-13]